MTGIGPDNLLRRWAAKRLGVSPDASVESARAAFLRRLPGEDFVPHTALVHAARAMGVLRSDDSRDVCARFEAVREEEEALRGEVEDFADRYWLIPPAGRRDRCSSLLMRAGDLPSRRSQIRLRELEAGLDIVGPELPASTDPDIAELARRVCALYVLRPGPRAREWQSLLNETRGRIWHWKQTAAKFRALYPAIAALQPQVVEELASWEPPPQFAPPHRPKPPPAAAPARRQYGLLIWLICIVLSAIMQTFRPKDTAPSPPTFPALPAYRRAPAMPLSPIPATSRLPLPPGTERPRDPAAAGAPAGKSP
jgi:hypothetical protein